MVALLREILLQTGAPSEQRQFYTETLGLPVVDSTGEAFTLQAGETRLVFAPAGQGEHPFYHFAFNISENKIDAAVTWLEERVSLLPHPESGDPVTPWPAWDAHAVYFRDPAGNVVEFIARHGLENAAPGPFEPGDIRSASEIGLPVPDVPAAADWLRLHLGLPTYSAGGELFCALGDAEGLLIIVKTGRPWFPTEDLHAGVFPLEMALAQPKMEKLVVPNTLYRIRFVPWTLNP